MFLFYFLFYIILFYFSLKILLPLEKALKFEGGKTKWRSKNHASKDYRYGIGQKYLGQNCSLLAELRDLLNADKFYG